MLKRLIILGVGDGGGKPSLSWTTRSKSWCVFVALGNVLKIPALWLSSFISSGLSCRNPHATHNSRRKRRDVAVLFRMPELEVSIISIIKRVGKWIVVCLYNVTEVYASEALDEAGQLSSEFYSMAFPEKNVLGKLTFLPSKLSLLERVSSEWGSCFMTFYDVFLEVIASFLHPYVGWCNQKLAQIQGYKLHRSERGVKSLWPCFIAIT